MSSRNSPTIKTLVNGIGGGLSPGQTYDLMKRITDDLDTIYNTLFTGPLPAVSGQNLILTDTPETNFPDKVAFTDKANVFTVDQTVHAVIYGDNIRSTGAVAGLITEDRGTPGNYGGMYKTGGVTRIWCGPFGDTILYNDSGGVGFCVPVSSIPATPSIVIGNGTSIYGRDTAGTGILSMITVDSSNLVYLGINAAASGQGHVGIPTVLVADIPVAGASRNGVIVIDKTNNRLCYFSSGNRYYLTGTAF